MLSGILLTAGSIGVMCAAGSGITMLLSWFNNYEPNFEKKGKGGGREPFAGGPAGPNRDKIERLSNSIR